MRDAMENIREKLIHQKLFSFHVSMQNLAVDGVPEHYRYSLHRNLLSFSQQFAHCGHN